MPLAHASQQGQVTGSSMRIAFIGDSLVNGTGDEEMLGWVGRVCASAAARGHDVTCYNLGVRRERSVDIAARWRHEVASRLPAEHDGRVVFSFGTNDAMRVPGPAPAAETLAALAMMLRHRDERPMLFVGPQPVADPALNQRIMLIDAALTSACAAAGVPCLSVFARLVIDPVWMSAVAAGDGAHPRADGYRRLAQMVDGWEAWRRWLP